jgi:dipeptidyl aminopeptidase/acylaminoacyl peptidase
MFHLKHPVLIQHGTADNLVPTEQSINFAADLEKVLGNKKMTLDLLEGAGHDISQFNEKSNVDKVFAFLDKYLK